MPEPKAQPKVTPPVRDTVVRLRVRTEERDAWQAQASAQDKTLADLIRERMGGSVPVKRSPRPVQSGTDSVLASHCGRIAILLSEIAHRCSTENPLDYIRLTANLMTIERQIAALFARDVSADAD